MKATHTLALVVTAIGLQACAVQGTHSLRPNGITLNRSLRLGADAFEPNPFSKQTPIVKHVNSYDYSPLTTETATTTNSYVTNNYYTPAERTIETYHIEERPYYEPTNIVITPVY